MPVQPSLFSPVKPFCPFEPTTTHQKGHFNAEEFSPVGRKTISSARHLSCEGCRLSADLSYHLIIKAKCDKRRSDLRGKREGGWMNFDLFPESHISFSLACAGRRVEEDWLTPRGWMTSCPLPLRSSPGGVSAQREGASLKRNHNDADPKITASDTLGLLFHKHTRKNTVCKKCFCKF